MCPIRLVVLSILKNPGDLPVAIRGMRSAMRTEVGQPTPWRTVLQRRSCCWQNLVAVGKCILEKGWASVSVLEGTKKQQQTRMEMQCEKQCWIFFGDTTALMRCPDSRSLPIFGNPALHCRNFSVFELLQHGWNMFPSISLISDDFSMENPVDFDWAWDFHGFSIHFHEISRMDGAQDMSLRSCLRMTWTGKSCLAMGGPRVIISWFPSANGIAIVRICYTYKLFFVEPVV